MNDARVKLPNILKNKTRTDIKTMIENNIYNESNQDIAIRYFVYEECMIDIAILYDVDRRTIRRKLDKVVRELERIA